MPPWLWSPITQHSQLDNLPPIVPVWDDEHTALVWMRGVYRSMHDYDVDIVALTEFGPMAGEMAARSDEEAAR